MEPGAFTPALRLAVQIREKTLANATFFTENSSRPFHVLGDEQTSLSMIVPYRVSTLTMRSPWANLAPLNLESTSNQNVGESGNGAFFGLQDSVAFDPKTETARE